MKKISQVVPPNRNTTSIRKSKFLATERSMRRLRPSCNSWAPWVRLAQRERKHAMGAIDPERSQFDAFKALPRDQPIHMLNLVKVRDLAAYPEGHPEAGKGVTGRDAYRAYGR